MICQGLLKKLVHVALSAEQRSNYCTILTSQYPPECSQGFSAASEDLATLQLYFINFATSDSQICFAVLNLFCYTAQILKCKLLIQTLLKFMV